MSDLLYTHTQRSPFLLRVAVFLLACAFAFPAVYLVYRGFGEGADPFELALTRRILEPLWGSLRLAVVVSITAMLLGLFLAWATTRCDLPATRLWRVLIPLPLVFPSFLSAAAFIYALNPGGLLNGFLVNVGVHRTPEVRGFWGAWLVLTLMTYPYVYLPVAARLRQLPGALEESARLLGDSVSVVFLRVCLPQVASAAAAGTLLVFLYTLSDFGAVHLLRYDTLTRVVYNNRLFNQPLALAASLLLMVGAALAVLAEHVVSRSLPEGSRTETSPPVTYSLGLWRLPFLGLVVSSLIASVGVPMLSLSDWAYSGVRQVVKGERPLTVGLFDIVGATFNTLGVSLAAAIVAVMVVLPIAMLAGRFRSHTGLVAHTVVVSMFAMPGILIALSVRFLVLRSELVFTLVGGSMLLLIFAYVVRFGSLAIGSTLVAVRSVPIQMHEAARVLGAGSIRRFLTVDSPIMIPGLFAGAGLVLMSVMKELPISLLVAPIGFHTLATRMFNSIEEAFRPEVGIMSVVLVLMLVILAWFLVLSRRDVY